MVHEVIAAATLNFNALLTGAITGGGAVLCLYPFMFPLLRRRYSVGRAVEFTSADGRARRG